MSNPAFSIIIPAKNEEKHLRGCLASIKALDYPSELVEVIVVDNGSSDRTCEIAESFGARVLVHRSGNVSGLRNLGVAHATGDILAFIDADCIALQDWLKTAAKYADRRDIAAWGAPPEPPERATWVQRTWYLVRQKPQTVQDVEWLESMNLFVRKDRFLAVQGFNEGLVTCEDVDLSYRLAREGRIVSDSNIRVIHLGEARTVSEFVRKEIWRGKGNLVGIRRHGLTLKELPSLMIPLYFGVVLPAALLVAVLFRTPPFLLVFAVLLLAPGSALLFKLRGRHMSTIAAARLVFLANVYFFARTLAILK